MKRKVMATFLASLSIGLATTDTVRSDTIINFDSLPAKGNPISGAALSDYLAQFGVTISSVTPGTAVTVYDARDIYADIQPVIPPSPFNVISQAGSLDPVSYTLMFALLQDHFSMTRTGVRAGTTGIALPEWQASAYDASGNLLGTVGENAMSIFSDIPAQTFTLNGPNIQSVVIASDNQHFAAFGAVILDNFALTAVPAAVPEPPGLITAAIGGVLLVGYRQCRRRRWRFVARGNRCRFSTWS